MLAYENHELYISIYMYFILILTSDMSELKQNMEKRMSLKIAWRSVFYEKNWALKTSLVPC